MCNIRDKSNLGPFYNRLDTKVDNFLISIALFQQRRQHLFDLDCNRFNTKFVSFLISVQFCLDISISLRVVAEPRATRKEATATAAMLRQ